jgi:hypothetical protein
MTQARDWAQLQFKDENRRFGRLAMKPLESHTDKTLECLRLARVRPHAEEECDALYLGANR